MSSMNKNYVILGSGFVLAIAVGVWLKKSYTPKATGSADITAANPAGNQAANPATAGSLSSERAAIAKQLPKPSFAAPAPTSGSGKSLVGNIHSQFVDLKETLSQYSGFKQKPLLTAAEKTMQKDLFSRGRIEEAKKFILTPETAFGIDTIRAHQVAVEFLKESYKVEKEFTRAQVLEIMLDKQIESTNISTQTKSILSADKAEIMFHFLAMDNTLKEDLKKSMPGSNTQVILANVTQEHQRNLAISAQEVKAYKAGRL